MRTTLTLDPDVARMLTDEAHRLRKPFKQVVNDALRRGLDNPRPDNFTAKDTCLKLHQKIICAGATVNL